MKGTPLTDEIVDYIDRLFPPEDELLRSLRTEAEAAEIPPIQIAPEQGKLLSILVRATGAVRILEIGTLAGYSSIVLARALPEGGHLDTLEIDPFHATFAREMVERAGLSGTITVHTGIALDLLERDLSGELPYDIIFIDADKPNYIRYVDLSLRLLRPGGLLIGDNALAWGEVTDAQTDREDVQGIRAFNQYVADHPDLDGSIIPSGDGMCIAIYRPEEKTTTVTDVPRH